MEENLGAFEEKRNEAAETAESAGKGGKHPAGFHRVLLLFPKKLPPFLLRRGCGGQVRLVIHSACTADGTFRGPRSLKRPCPTLRVVLVSCVSCGSAVLTPSRKALLIFRWY